MTEAETSPVARVRTLPATAKRRLSRTVTVSRAILRRRDTLAVLAGVAIVYLVAFLYVVQDLAFSGSALSVTVADDPLATMFQSAPGTFMHRPVVLLELGVATWEFSPLNTLLGGGIAALVGLNLALSYLAVVQPRSCGVGAGAGVVAGIPALLAGSTCCAPVVVLVLGIQATGTLITVFAWLLPVSILLLLATLVHITGRINPETLPTE
jgi:hypothetical protein